MLRDFENPAPFSASDAIEMRCETEALEGHVIIIHLRLKGKGERRLPLAKPHSWILFAGSQPRQDGPPKMATKMVITAGINLRSLLGYPKSVLQLRCRNVAGSLAPAHESSFAKSIESLGGHACRHGYQSVSWDPVRLERVRRKPGRHARTTGPLCQPTDEWSARKRASISAKAIRLQRAVRPILRAS